MLWSQVYALKSYIRSSLWIVPFISLLLYVVVIRMVYAIDRETAWQPPGGAWGVLGTQSILETIITLMLTFIVFTFGSLLVAIQVAGGQLTPRIIATTLLRDNAIRFTVGLFTFTLLFATGVLARLERRFPLASDLSRALLGFCSIAAFLHLIDYAARLLRPVSIIWRVGNRGGLLSIASTPSCKRTSASLQDHARSFRHQTVSSNVTASPRLLLAVNLKALVAEAQKANGIIELVPRVGDFVASGKWCSGCMEMPAHRRPPPEGIGRIRARAHHRAGFNVCVSNYRRHRDQGAVESN